MGLFGKEKPEPEARFQMREKLISIGDDYWIEDDDGHKRVPGRTARRSGSATPGCSRTRSGNEVATDPGEEALDPRRHHDRGRRHARRR